MTRMSELRVVGKLRMPLLRASILAFLPLAAFSGHSWMGETLIDWAVRWPGYLLIMGGLGLRMWSTLHIGSRKSKRLVTDGPYSLCRNPLYVGTLAIAFGASLCFENVLMIVLTLGIVLPVHLWTVKEEEHYLAERFGQEYSAYREKVNRFLPSWQTSETPETVVVSSRAVLRATLEASGVLLIPPLAHLVEVLQMSHVLPAVWQVL